MLSHFIQRASKVRFSAPAAILAVICREEGWRRGSARHLDEGVDDDGEEEVKNEDENDDLEKHLQRRCYKLVGTLIH
jgi:hypothetical protein